MERVLLRGLEEMVRKRDEVVREYIENLREERKGLDGLRTERESNGVGMVVESKIAKLERVLEDGGGYLGVDWSKDGDESLEFGDAGGERDVKV